MNDYDLIPPSNRRSLVDAYREASQRAYKTFDALEKVCVENCLIKIQIALSNHNSSEKTVKVYVTDVQHLSKQACEKVSNELKQLDIQHTYNCWAGINVNLLKLGLKLNSNRIEISIKEK